MDESHVVAENLVAAYGEGALRVVVLDDVSFAIPRGKVTAITGPSGCGKTTLLSLLGGMETAQGGSLRVDGRDLCRMSAHELSQHRRFTVGFVFQFFHLLPTMTARENVVSGLDPLGWPRQERLRRADRALAAVGMASLAKRFPHELSGGQQQRVAVARAWAKEPPLLLADEPTGNLDDAQGREILDLLIGGPETNERATLVIVTHDPSVASRADHRLEFLHGRVVEAVA